MACSCPFPRRLPAAAAAGASFGPCLAVAAKCVPDDERLGETHRRRQGAEAADLRLLHPQDGVGFLGDLADRAVRDGENGRLLGMRGADHLYRLLRIRPITDADQKIARGDGGDLLAPEARDAIDEYGALCALLQGVGEISGDGKGTADADDVYGVR